MRAKLVKEFLNESFDKYDLQIGKIRWNGADHYITDVEDDDGLKLLYLNNSKNWKT